MRSILCTVLICVSPALAQTPVLDETVTVTEVLLDVTVTDRDGHVILGLGPDDFVVEEEGVPVEVTSLSFYSSRIDLDAPDRDRERDAARDRLFILFLHDRSRQDPSQRVRFLQAARRARQWVDESLLPGDWVAVASFDFKLKVQQDFTRDRGLLDQAIRQAVLGKDPNAGNWPSRSPATGQAPSLLAGLPRGRELRRQTATVYAALERLAEASRRVRTRKTLILLSQGFEGLPGSLGYRPDPRDYPGMMHALNDANVAVYAVDLGDIGAESSLRDSLHLLASDTGGRHFRDQVSFGGVFERISDENSGYYLLGYEARHGVDVAGYRRVKVTALNPELRIRGRGGFVVRAD